MIHLVDNVSSKHRAEWLDGMHRIRAAVFRDRLNWDVQVVDGRERDEFDDLDPLYLVSVSPAGRVRGTLRLLPTTGPNMLRDVFSCLLEPGQTIASPLIWEASRFAIDPAAASRDANALLNPITSELLCGMIEVGLTVGLDFFAAVVDARMKRILQLADYPVDVIGVPQRIGVAKAYACLLEVSEQTWQAVAARGGITDRVISREGEGPDSAVAA